MFSSGTLTYGGKPSIDIDPQNIDRLADMAIASSAWLTMSTANVPLRNTLPDFDAAHRIANCQNLANKLMPSRNSQRNSAFAPSVPLVNMPIGAANPGVRHAHDHVPRPHLRNRRFLDKVQPRASLELFNGGHRPSGQIRSIHNRSNSVREFAPQFH